MNRKFLSLIALSVLGSFSSFAGVKVTSLDLKVEGTTGYVNVLLDGRSSELPDIKVHGKTIEVTVNQADPFSAIFKNVKGASLSANVLNGKAVVRAVLPYEVDSDKVNLGGTNNNIEISFPRGKANETAHAPAAAVKAENNVAATSMAAATATLAKAEVKTEQKPTAFEKKFAAATANKVQKELLNEDYLNKLMKENVARRDTDAPTADDVKTPPTTEMKSDVVDTKLAAATQVNDAPITVKGQAKTTAQTAPMAKNNNFSFAGYAVKFMLFLGLVLGLFYGVVQLLKKGVFNRGKLGFLNNGQMIEVLSTTYVAPKKSLMIIKAHKQLFLVANSETGLQFLAEMKDTSGLIKEGEKLVTGANFDINLSNLVSSDAAPQFTIKEDITQSTAFSDDKGLAALASKAAKATDIVKFSDELKKKAKKLRPIEFN